MRVIKNEKTVFIDVDETLVHHLTQTLPQKDYIFVKDTVRGGELIVKPNHNNIRLLLEEHARGSHIVVWSRGGYAWAETVVKALGLTKKVHQVMTKPMIYIDDKDVSEWLPYRVYLKPDEIYKK
jgi:hypothetical protein